ncbi:MAG: class I SAM-dependent methyltransferase [Planctomycetes bacterium]|nr:class I SAM-dependent methyltransferase [Planctomycetota bacterium]
MATPTAPAKATTMRAQYGAWPYPHVPLLATLPSTHPFELHASWLWDRAGSGPAPTKPRVWIAGCGTFRPYTFAVANPHAEIVAGDLSEPSLAVARRRCTVHGVRNVAFAPLDLDDPSTWPEGRFDVIECYGALTNCADPLATLRSLRARLTPGGVLRLMVYPHWSRQRVFQLQRVARLLGFTAAERSHPARFRAFVKRLPAAHPLRYAFTTYADSRNDTGVVDAFLHGGDRGFTGWQLGALLRDADMTPAFWFHRPWAQPDAMSERLSLRDRSQSEVLAYLDLWQELRGNFVVLARANDAPPRIVQEPTPHPRFYGDDDGLRHRLRLLRLGLVGGTLPSRTGYAAVKLAAADVRALRAGDAPERLRASGLVLGGDHGSRLPTHADWPGEPAFLAHAAGLRTGRRAPNPLYAHLFAAFELAQRCPELRLPDLDGQMGRWLPWADPLEGRPVRFGLTPYGTLQRFRQSVADHLARADLGAAASYADVRLRDDAATLQRVRSLLAAGGEAPAIARDDATLRELAVLLLGHDTLFLSLTPA